MMKIDLAGYRKADQLPVEEPISAEIGPFEDVPPEPEPPEEPEADLSFTDEEVPDVEELSSDDTVAFSTLETAEDQEEPAPEPGQDDFSLLRSAPAAAETIALSLRDMDLEPPVVPLSAEPSAPAEPEEPLPEPVDDTVKDERAPSGASKVRIAVFAALLLAAAGFLIWSQRDFVSGLVGLKPKPASVSRPAVAPAPSQKTPAPAAKDDSSAAAVKTDSTTAAAVANTPSAPAPSAAQPSAPTGKTAHTPTSAGASNAALSALDALNRAAPPRVWLTSVTVTSEGAYELKGMSFSHEAMSSFAQALSSAGTIASRGFPARVASPEHVYSFSVAGKLGGIAPPGALDVIPPDGLAGIGASLKAKSQSLGVTFVRLPRTGAKYGETDLPFEAVGTYEAVMSMLNGLAVSGKMAVNRISVNPAARGGAFDRIRAGFSLRSVSPL